MHRVRKRQRNAVRRELTRVANVHISVLQRHTIGFVLDREHRRLAPDHGKEEKWREAWDSLLREGAIQPIALGTTVAISSL